MLRHRRRPLVALALLAGLALALPLLPAEPASAAGTRALWSTLADGQHLAYDPAADILEIDVPITAAQIRLSQVGTSVAFAAPGKTVYLDGTKLAQLRFQGVYFSGLGGKGSGLIVGDGNASSDDTTTGLSSIGLSLQFTDSQFVALGGTIAYEGGPGNDRFVGAPAIRSLTHLSRTANAAAPTNSLLPSISRDGSKVAFEGGWTGYGSTSNSATDVIVRDVDAGTFTQEHRSWTGSAGLSGSGAARLAADGNFVVFASSSQLLPTSTPSNTIFRTDTRNDTDVVAVSTTNTGVLANGPSGRPDVSANGNVIAFLSRASNLAPNGSSTQDDVFVKDLSDGSLYRASTGQGGGDANADIVTPRISDDGRWVVFASAATNLTDVETGGGALDVYRWDRSDGSLVNVTAGGTGSGPSSDPDVANDGSVAFVSGKSFTATDTDGFDDVYSWNGYDTYRLASQTASKGQVTPASGEPSVSRTGRWVAFRAYSDLLVPGDTNGYSDIFVKDLDDDRLVLVSRSTSAQANQSSSRPAISADGRHVAFESAATNLADIDANGTGADVFVVGNPLVQTTLAGDTGDDRYVIDPAGVLWHVAQRREGAAQD